MAFIKKFKKLKTDNTVLDKLQDQLRDILNNISDIPILNGNRVGPIKMVANTPTIVNHGLGRNYIDWYTSRPSAAARFSEIASTNPSQYVIIESDANCIVSFWIT